MEQPVGNALSGEIKIKQLHKKCSITVHSRRKRLADTDGISFKAALDGIVQAGILKSDTVESIQEVSYSQEKCKAGEEEETIISIYVEA